MRERSTVEAELEQATKEREDLSRLLGIGQPRPPGVDPEPSPREPHERYAAAARRVKELHDELAAIDTASRGP